MRFRALRGWLGRWERDEEGRRRPGAWSQAYSGETYWPLDPLPEEIHFDDIVAGLREPRYRGQTREFYTVLEHSVLVSCMAEKLASQRTHTKRLVELCGRLGLLHDATEAYIGDVTRPLKYQRVMRGYRKLEAKWEAAVMEHFHVFAGAPYDVPDWEAEEAKRIVHEVDNRIVLDEIEALMIDPDMWSRRGRYVGVEPLGIEIPGWTWEQAMIAFCQRFSELWPDWPDVTYARQHAH